MPGERERAEAVPNRETRKDIHKHSGHTVTSVVSAYSTFLRNEQPSVSLALPPVGWHSTVEHEAQNTTVEACEKTVVI